MKKHSVEEKGLLMQYHSINIEKLSKRVKNKVSNIACTLNSDKASELMLK